MTCRLVESWIAAYLHAWRTFDPDAIGSLFAEDASYAYHPWDEPLRGRAAIVANWMKEPEDPRDWRAHYAPWLVRGNRAVAIGSTEYRNGRSYVNVWQLVFDRERRCREFVEWFMEPPGSSR